MSTRSVVLMHEEAERKGSLIHLGVLRGRRRGSPYSEEASCPSRREIFPRPPESPAPGIPAQTQKNPPARRPTGPRGRPTKGRGRESGAAEGGVLKRGGRRPASVITPPRNKRGKVRVLRYSYAKVIPRLWLERPHEGPDDQREEERQEEVESEDRPHANKSDHF